MSNILPVPHRLQLADGYCLPACVQMVLAYWGLERDQAKLARQLGLIAGAGVPGNRIRRLASRTLNVFYGQGVWTDLETALNQGIPPIVLVHTGQLPYWSRATAHAVVLVGLEADQVVVNDPGQPQAPLRVSQGDLELAWDDMANLYALLSKKS